MKLKIQAVHFDADEKLKDFIERKVEKLDTFHDRIIENSVTLTLEHNGAQVKDKVAVIKTQVPGVLLVAKEHSKSFEASIDLAVDSIRRQLKKRKTKISQRA